MNLIIMGPQGSGKGTYGSRLAPILGIPFIEAGKILREIAEQDTPLGKKVAGYLKRGELVPDDIVIETIKHRLTQPDCSKGFVLDGFPRSDVQAEALDKIVKLDVAINLVVPEWILIARLTTRRTCKDCGKIYNIKYLKPKKEGICDKCGGQLIQRADETEEGIKKRLEVYERETKPLIKYYKDKGILIENKCNDIDIPPEIMVDRILSKLKDFGLKF